MSFKLTWNYVYAQLYIIYIFARVSEPPQGWWETEEQNWGDN